MSSCSRVWGFLLSILLHIGHFVIHFYFPHNILFIPTSFYCTELDLVMFGPKLLHLLFRLVYCFMMKLGQNSFEQSILTNHDTCNILLVKYILTKRATEEVHFRSVHCFRAYICINVAFFI